MKRAAGRGHSGRMPSEEPRAEEARAIELLRGTSYGRVAMSRHAMPFITLARHIVVGRTVLLRMHRGHGHHAECDGSVVAYAADSVGVTGCGGVGREVWSVQFVGTARLVEPTAGELARFGPPPHSADAAPYEPAYLRIEPRFATVHHLGGVPPG